MTTPSTPAPPPAPASGPGPAAPPSPAAAKAAVKRSKKVVESEGIAHISATFNNVLITITDMRGNTIAWGSAALPARRCQAIPQGDPLPHREVRGGAPRLCTRPARAERGGPRGTEAFRVRAPAPGEAEGEADLRAFGAPVPQHVLLRHPAPRREGHQPAGGAGDPVGQRRLSHGLRHQPPAGAAAGPARPHPGERRQGGRPVLPGQTGPGGPGRAR